MRREGQTCGVETQPETRPNLGHLLAELRLFFCNGQKAQTTLGTTSTRVSDEPLALDLKHVLLLLADDKIDGVQKPRAAFVWRMSRFLQRHWKACSFGSVSFWRLNGRVVWVPSPGPCAHVALAESASVFD